MTFEEAKKRIERCRKLSTDEYNRYKDEFMKGAAFAYSNALAIFDGIDTDHELSRNPDTLTLKELAQELRKIFTFRYLTTSRGSDLLVLWKVKPRFIQGVREWYINDFTVDNFMLIDTAFLSSKLDLSEYRDADGNIDYSKCIVEVE